MRKLTAYVAVAWLLAGCSTATNAGGASGERITPPRMASRGHLDLSSSMAPVTGNGKVTVQVAVDSTGRPEMNTLRIVGGSAAMKAPIARFIESSLFTPAQRAGMPVAGTFTMRLDFQTRAVLHAAPR